MVGGKAINVRVLVGGEPKFSRYGMLWRIELESSAQVTDAHLCQVRDRFVDALRTVTNGREIQIANEAPVVF